MILNLPNNLFSKIFGTLIIVSCYNSLIAQTFIPGNTYYDVTGFVEYRAGNLPIIISAPHGGSLEPSTIPDRDCTNCVYVKDAWTKTIVEGMHAAFFDQTGCYPHVIINLLHRKKFDANRNIGDAADGNPTVEQAWSGYHTFIDAAKNQAVQDYGRGLFLDIHGHGHTIQRIELGYLLSDAELRLSDADLNTTTYIEESSIRTLVGDNLQNHTHSALLRGEESFGTLMEEKGFPSVPSFSDPFPDVGEPYFDGGYNTQRHGSRDNAGDIDAIQLELNQDIRFNATTREILIDSLTTAANQYINFHYNNQYLSNFCSLILPIELNKIRPQNLILYPNPSPNGKVTLQYFSTEEEVTISVYDITGKLIFHQILPFSSEENQSYFDFSFDNKGIYLIKIGTDYWQRIQKLVIE
ncbi:MAG: N-formylglutamate amidohydrolase [Paraglaciecola sp.]|jgi:N-formylglutamate amidohydrolase